MENELNAPGVHAAVAKNEPAGGSGAASGDGSLDLDNFLESETPPAGPADQPEQGNAAEPDEYDALRPDAPDKPQEEGKGEAKPGEPAKPVLEADVDGLKLVMPEGVSSDNPELKSFVALTRELNVPAEATQKLVDLYAAKHRAMIGEVVEADKRFRATLDKRWIRENHGDPEFGGGNYDRSCNYVTAALRKFIPKDELMATVEKDGRMGFLEFFTQANIRNNPLMFRFLARVGRHVAEAAPLTSEATPAPGNRSAAETLFDDI